MSGSDTDSDNDDYDSDKSSDLSSSDESELSFLDGIASDDDSDDYDSDDYDSDIDMKSNLVRAARRRPRLNTSASKSGAKTMAEKVIEEVQKQLSDPSSAELSPAELMDLSKRACDMQEELLDKLNKLGERLPSNTLDQLIEELGGPDEVAVRMNSF